jgi:hypothetical protein
VPLIGDKLGFTGLVDLILSDIHGALFVCGMWRKLLKPSKRPKKKSLKRSSSGLWLDGSDMDCGLLFILCNHLVWEPDLGHQGTSPIPVTSRQAEAIMHIVAKDQVLVDMGICAKCKDREKKLDKLWWDLVGGQL